MTNDQDGDLIPIIRDLRPFPETSEARARGCRCRLTRDPEGTPILEKNGQLIYSLTKGYQFLTTTRAELFDDR
jgi:hypothetical protein